MKEFTGRNTLFVFIILFVFVVLGYLLSFHIFSRLQLRAIAITWQTAEIHWIRPLTISGYEHYWCSRDSSGLLPHICKVYTGLVHIWIHLLTTLGRIISLPNVYIFRVISTFPYLSGVLNLTGIHLLPVTCGICRHTNSKLMYRNPKQHV